MIRTNVGKPDKKKKGAAPAAPAKPTLRLKVESEKIDPLTFARGKETKTYTAARHLGGKGYGSENPNKKDAAFIDEARAKKQDIAYKDGKPYRAGVTTVTKAPDKIGFTQPKVKLTLVTEKTKKVMPASKTAAEISAKGKKPGKTEANPVPWTKNQGGGSGKSEGKNLSKYKAKTKVKYKKIFKGNTK